MKIRHATNFDISGLLPLLAELGYPASLEDFTIRFKRFLKTPGYGVAVCEIEKQIVGFIAWSRSNTFVSNAVRFRIEGLVVANNYRGQGIGKKLMRFVEDIARSNGICIIDLVSGLRRAKDGTHEFYKSLGYKNEGHMAKLYLRKEYS
ncbi:MAG: Acetyltransferase [Candidatus Midichloriaceae bacterium]|jgi:GNAT superfamily N-acetyltransferase|nr:Acetyltransferase [Candidatus Midichloriaceae bacterium]